MQLYGGMCSGLCRELQLGVCVLLLHQLPVSLLDRRDWAPAARERIENLILCLVPAEILEGS